MLPDTILSVLSKFESVGTSSWKFPGTIKNFSVFSSGISSWNVPSACFYQEEEFFASEKIVSLETTQRPLTKYIAFFLIQILKLESDLFSYGGRKWTVEKQLKQTMIKLPVRNSDDEPDYNFMENYIKSRSFSCNI